MLPNIRGEILYGGKYTSPPGRNHYVAVCILLLNLDCLSVKKVLSRSADIIHILRMHAECDISVSKLLGFETFPIFWMVSDSVSKKFGIEKSIRFGTGKNLVSKKVSDSVSEIFSIEKVSASVLKKLYLSV